MIKVVWLLRKKPGMSDEDFFKYWHEKHAPLGVKVTPGLRKYTQNHLIKQPGIKYDFDGFAEVWLDDFEAYKKLISWYESSQSKELRDDEENFLDKGSIVAYAVEEHVIL